LNSSEYLEHSHNKPWLHHGCSKSVKERNKAGSTALVAGSQLNKWKHEIHEAENKQ
jgi:hypothetical protein